jgi:thiol-disulfide isomerase/thioredoxin
MTLDAKHLLSRIRLPVGSMMPAFDGATGWLNSKPLTPGDLMGKVVAVDFWTFTCINWLRTLPYIRAWSDTYADKGLVVIGVHTPEFEVEHDVDNIERAVREMGIKYPIAIDSDYAVWNAFSNQYWPALYIADADGNLRYMHFGEGAYDRSEEVIRELLGDAGVKDLPPKVDVQPQGIEAEADWSDVRSPETYVGYARGQNFASPEAVAYDEPRVYSLPRNFRLNEWALAGDWTIGQEETVCNAPNGRIAYRFHARDLHLILMPPAASSAAKFRVRLDGEAPGDAHGLDVDADGNGVVTETRLHQLIRQRGPITDRLFEIEVLDPGAAALCFTFG